MAINPSMPNRACPIPALKTWDKHGFIWIANHDVSDGAFPEFLKPGYELIGSFTQKFNAPLPVVLDNFGEIEHAHTVHTFIGPGREDLSQVSFDVRVGEKETAGFSSCRFRRLPSLLTRLYGLRAGDIYHNDWIFKFTPLHGSYFNYWTDCTGQIQRPISFIITSFLVPSMEREVLVNVFVQISIKGKAAKFTSRILKFATMLIAKYEIYADSRASGLPRSAGTAGWHLSQFDKQIIPNRQRLNDLYLQSNARNCSLVQHQARSINHAEDGR
jgi:hypothetical protein